MTIKDYANLKQQSMSMTGYFETSNSAPICYGITSGNWDGAAVSHGVLQFNFKTGNLQTLWNYMDTNYNTDCRNIFGTDYNTWHTLINDTLANQQAFGDQWGDPATGKHSMLPPWSGYFSSLGQLQASIDKQVSLAQSYFDNALKWFNALGLYSRRGFALMFDISVQLGRLLPQNMILQDFRGIATAGRTRADIEKDKLYAIVNRVSYEYNRVTGTSQSIVYDRKKAVVDGSNTSGFDVTGYDLNLNEPALKGGVIIGGY
jgi:hypothetical protein